MARKENLILCLGKRLWLDLLFQWLINRVIHIARDEGTELNKERLLGSKGGRLALQNEAFELFFR